MWKILIMLWFHIVLFFLFSSNNCSVLDEDSEIEILSHNLYENLKAFPHYELIDGDLNDESQYFFERQIENFEDLVLFKGAVLRRSEVSRQKRSSFLDDAAQQQQDLYNLDSIMLLETIPVDFPEDITVFQLRSEWYVAVIDSLSMREAASQLIIYQYKDNLFDLKITIPIKNGLRLSTINFDNYILLMIAENVNSEKNFKKKSGVYVFDGKHLVNVQSLDMNYANDINMWKINNEIYMSFAQFMSNRSGIINYEVEIPIYKWMGRHFDSVQTIYGKGVKKIVAFEINLNHFLAIANSRDDKGDSRQYSEIYKYDFETEKYVVYQRILTYGCTDIGIFTLPLIEDQLDYFLVVGNYEDTDESSLYQINPIIYKYIEDYFIPFQTIEVPAVQQWLPFKGTNNEFVLLALSRYEALKYYQYDGWSFQEIPQKYNQHLNQASIKSIRRVEFNGSALLVVTNKNHFGGLFELVFSELQSWYTIYHDLLNWCEASQLKVASLTNDDILSSRTKRADLYDLDSYQEDLEQISDNIASLDSLVDKYNIANRPIFAEEIIISDTAFISNLKTNTINDIAADDLLDNILDIGKDMEFDQLTFDSLESKDSITIKQINGQDPSFLRHTSDNLSFDFITINGTIIAKQGFNIKGKLNNIIVDEKNILLKVGNQSFTFTGPLSVNTTKNRNRTVESINKANNWEDAPKTIDRITNLTVKDLTILGLMNDIDITVLDDIVLKQTGNQVITAEYFFDELIVEELQLKGLINNVDVSGLVPIDNGEYEINEDVIFNDIAVENLEISTSLNDIAVYNGKLDILLTDSNKEQHVTAEKVFENVILNSSISLQGNIESEILRKMNPAVAIEEDLNLTFDQFSFEHVEIEDLLQVTDILTLDGSNSLMRLKKDGLSLDEKVIKPRLNFTQSINVGEIFVDTINEYDPSNFVTLGTDETQIIEGLKTVEGDLILDGNSSIRTINNINVEDLDNNVIKLTKDQVIIGEYHIKDVTVDRIFSDIIVIGDVAISDQTVRNENLTLILENDLIIDEFKAESMSVRGHINGYVFQDIINDVVSKDCKELINGTKTFENLSIQNLTTKNGLDINPNTLINKIIFNDSIKIDKIDIQNLYFTEKFNGIQAQNFGNIEVDDTGARLVTDEHKFDTLYIYGRVFINSNQLNDLSIDEIAENTIKIDEPFSLDSANFDSFYINNSLILNGHIENFDIDNIIWSSSVSDDIIWDEKVFEGNLSIDGNVEFNGFVNGLNITKFCDFAMNRVEEKNLTVRGNAFFANGPKIVYFNNINIADILENAWFKNEDVVLTENIEFDDVIFEENVFIKGFLDNIIIDYFAENYLSKTKDQDIPSTLNFGGGLILENGATVSEIALGGSVNDIILEELMRTVLLDDYDQVFETMIYLENCTIKNLDGDFLVNGLRLDEDVMRYDKTNVVTGKKYFENLNVGNLKLDKHINIQDVDILSWINNSVMTNTDYKVTGEKTLKNAVFRGNVRLSGHLNGIKFNEENILLRDLPQNITGHKIFISNGIDPVKFKTIKFKGLLNGIDLSELINNQAYEDEVNVIQSGINLRNRIKANNLIIKNIYHGVNVTELVTNITNLEALNNIVDEYKKLKIMSDVLKKSIQNQAFFLDQYKIIQTIPSLTNNLKIVDQNGNNQIGVLVEIDEKSKLEIYDWQEEKEQFVAIENITLPFRPYFVEQVLTGRYLYLEQKNGLFMSMSSQAKEIVLELATNKTVFTTSFMLPSTNENNPCTLFLYEKCNPKIFCEIDERITLLQILDSPYAHQAETMTIQGVLHLIIMNTLLEDKDSHIDIWKFNPEISNFQLNQSIFVVYPKSLSTASINGFHYLVIASSYLKNAKYDERVEIWRYDNLADNFVHWENLDVIAPNQVELAILPSNELFLYIITDDRAKSPLVYRYEGIAGFRLKVKGSVLPKIAYINQFMGGVGNKRHFIIAQSYEEINVIEAIFKGVKVDHD